MSKLQKELRELAQYQNQEGAVVSLYLNLSDPSRVSTELNSLVRTAAKRLEEDERFKAEQRKSIEHLLFELDRHVKSVIGPETRARLLVVFADTEGFRSEYHLQVPLPSRMVVQQNPYTRPLSFLLDEFPEYSILVADARNARLFSLFLGAFEEQPGFFIQNEVPDRVSVKKSMAVSAWGVYSGMGDQRIQRHVEDHIHRHLLKVAERTFELLKKDGFDRLILAAPDERTLSQLKDHLHSYLRQRVRGEFLARPEDADQVLREKALETARKSEHDEERRLLDRVLDLHFSGGLGVIGVQPVVDALNMGQVHTLVMNADFSTSGYLCPQDNHLSLGKASCPVCGGRLTPTERFPDEIVQEAINQGAEVRHTTVGHESFDSYGIGALLRFRI
ncbi:MAG: hypothetical protein ACQET7_10715 [Thermodesulfobacteriota bacterium]